MNFFMRICYANTNAIVTECYNTIYRTFGASWFFGFGKFIGAIAPFVMHPIYNSRGHYT